jgi:hypothetical protein
MPTIIKKFGKKTFILGLIFILTLGLFVRFSPVKAANLTKESDLLSDSRADTVSNHTITFVSTTAIIQSQTIIIKPDTAGDAFTLTGLVHADIDLAEDDDGGCDGTWTDEETVDGAATETEWGFAVNTGTDEITLTAPSGAGTYIVATRCVQIEIGANATHDGTGTIRIKNPVAIGSYDITITNSTDSGAAYVAVVTSGVAVTATVSEYLTFTIDDYSLFFGTWTAGSTIVRWATGEAGGSETEPLGDEPCKLTIKSNAVNGTSVTVRSLNAAASAGLYDSVSTNVIDPVAANGATTPISGTEGYAVYAKNASSITIDEAFDDDDDGELAISTSAQRFVYGTAGVNGTVDMALKAAIAVTTQAGSYADTLILVATPTY